MCGWAPPSLVPDPGHPDRNRARKHRSFFGFSPEFGTQERENAKLNSKRTAILICLALVCIASCGRKAPPVPWDTVVPRRIVDLTALSREGRLLLTWTVPKENTDKSPLTDLAELQILRSEGALVGGECRGCGEKPKPFYQMAVAGKEEELKGKKMSFFVTDLEARKVYVYEIVAVNRRGYNSTQSNPVTVYWDHPPQAPGMVRAERGDKRVDLFWDQVEGATGYNVYRRRPDQEFSLQPLNREPMTTTQYTDLNVENEVTYVYTVRAVKKVINTFVEGKGSLNIPVTPVRLAPPSSPTGLVAIALPTGVELNWRKNPEPDLLGYYVYRRKLGEREFVRLNDSPVAKETYVDPNVEAGQEYEYAVSAVDNSARKNESPRSEEVAVKYLH